MHVLHLSISIFCYFKLLLHYIYLHVKVLHWRGVSDHSDALYRAVSLIKHILTSAQDVQTETSDPTDSLLLFFCRKPTPAASAAAALMVCVQKKCVYL